MDPLNPKRFANHPALARIIEEGRTNLPTGITTSGALSAYAKNAADTIRDNREREKREIADLNNRLARYIENVRFLEAQNRVLENDIGLFRSVAGIHYEKVQDYFKAENASLFTLKRESEDKRNSHHNSIRKLEPEILTSKKNLEVLYDQRRKTREEKRRELKRLSEIESETAYVKRLIVDIEDEKNFVSHEISRLRGEIKKTLALRDKERKNLSRFNTQELLKRLNGNITQHEIAIRDEISKARRDTTDKNRDYFHKELQSALKTIRDQFDSESKKHRKTWEEWYKGKIGEIKKGSEKFSVGQVQAREELMRIRGFFAELRVKLSDADTKNQQLTKKIEDMKFQEEEDLRLFERALTEKENAVIMMREECTILSVELDRLVENQHNLRNEISHYRKLMENAENMRTVHQSNVVIDTPSPVLRTTSYHSYGAAYNHATEYYSSTSGNYNNISQFGPISQATYDPYASQDSTTINSQQFKSFSKGDIKFVEHKDESIIIENSNYSRSRDLSNWKIHHYQDGSLIGTFIFPVATHIQPQQKLSINSPNSTILLSDFITNLIPYFNFSKHTKTVLVDDADEEVGWYAHVKYSH